MLPSETSAQQHPSLPFALPSVENKALPSSASSNTSLFTPATFPESVFGWQALVLAFQSALASLPFLRRLPVFAQSEQYTRATRLSSRNQTVHMSQALSYTPNSSTPTNIGNDMGSQSSTDVTMLPVSPVSDGSTINPSHNSPSPTSAESSSNPSSSLALTSLPDELISMCYASLSAADLVALEHVSRRLHHLIAYDSVCWKRCTEARWGHLSSNTSILNAAARHAGTWKQLYSEKATKDTKNSPWLTLCKSEILAILDIIKSEKSSASPPECWPITTDTSLVPSSPPKENLVPMSTSSPVSVMTNNPPVAALSVVLLIDASSSVTDDDFDCMKTFARDLVSNLRDSNPEASVAVVQFNQHPKVEMGLTNVCKSKLSTSIDNMEQLMGSTDIAAPIRRARQILAEDDVRPGDRAIVLLTDGQTHADELQESEREARQASEEVGARLYTLGVGRDIDEVGLGRVAGGSEGGMHFTLRRLVPSK